MSVATYFSGMSQWSAAAETTLGDCPGVQQVAQRQEVANLGLENRGDAHQPCYYVLMLQYSELELLLLTRHTLLD